MLHVCALFRVRRLSRPCVFPLLLHENARGAAPMHAYSNADTATAKRPRDSPRESPPSESRCRYLSVSSLPGNCSNSELVRRPPLN